MWSPAKEGLKREESGSAGGTGTFLTQSCLNFKLAPRKGKWRKIGDLGNCFLKWAFGIIVYWRILQMLLFVSLFIC